MSGRKPYKKGEEKEEENAASAALSSLEEDVLAKTRARSSAGGTAARPGATGASALDERIAAKTRTGGSSVASSSAASASTPGASVASGVDARIAAKSSGRSGGAGSVASSGASDLDNRIAAKASGRSAADSASRAQGMLSHLEDDVLAKSRARQSGGAVSIDSSDVYKAKSDDVPDAVTSLESDVVAKGEEPSDSVRSAGAGAAAAATGGAAAAGQDWGQTQDAGTVAAPTPASDEATARGANVDPESGIVDYHENYQAPSSEAFPAMQAVTEEEMELIDTETGGVQAFVADEVVDAGGIEILRSDEEIEAEEKKKYTKKFLLVAACVMIVIVAIVVPVTFVLTDNDDTTTTERTVTEPPTSGPSAVPSLMPSSMPSTSRYQAVVAKLEPLSGSDLYDQSTPQFQAASWISDEDPAQLPLNDTLFEQRYIMALFYFATDGDNWITCSRDDSPTCGSQKGGPWLSGESECEWYGNKCVVEGGTDPATGEIVTDTFMAKPEWVGHISKIEHGTTEGNNLAGNFPSELGHLPAMHTIIIQNNPMFGTLPESFGNWTILQILVLSNNGLGSPFPEQILENNPNLGTIYIERNNFDGPIPNLASLPSLQRLRAFDNEFTGTIDPAFGDLVFLEEFNIRNNKHNGSIPEEFWKPSDNPPRQLDDFDVSENSLTGTISSKIGSMPFLKDYRVNDNKMNGTIPEELYNTPRLEELVLANNQFTGVITVTLGNLADTINEIDLSNNNFIGRFPSEQLDNVTRLKHLILNATSLTGSITPAICNKLNQGPYTKLETLATDCEEVTCDCGGQCECYYDSS